MARVVFLVPVYSFKMRNLFAGFKGSRADEMLRAFSVAAFLPLMYVLYGIFFAPWSDSNTEAAEDLTVHYAGERQIVNDNFSFRIPVDGMHLENTFQSMKKNNPSLLFLNFLHDPIIEHYSHVMVSVYAVSEPRPLDTIIDQFQRAMTKKDNTMKNELIVNEKVNVLGRDFHRVVLRRDRDYCMILYYFMEYEGADCVYEVLTEGSMSDLEVLKTIAEIIGLSARFESWKLEEDDGDSDGQLACLQHQHDTKINKGITNHLPH